MSKLQYVCFTVFVKGTLKRSIFWKVVKLMSTAMAVLITRGMLSSSSDSSESTKVKQERLKEEVTLYERLSN